MSLTGKALMYARLGSSASTGTGLYRRLRLGASRLNFYGPHILLKVNGTVRTNNFDTTNWEVTDRSRGQGKTLRVEVFGFTPAPGEEIILGGGSFSNRLFRGTITRIRRVRHKLNEGRAVYECQCVDWMRQLGNLKVTGKFQSVSATDIALSLMADFAPAGFTTNHLQTGLEVLDDFQCTMQTLPSALNQLCQRIGGAYYIDADKDLHLYVDSDTSGINPEAITASNPHVRSGFDYQQDIEGLKNRILVEGMGSNVSAQIPAGSTSLPVTSTDMFATSGTNEAKLEAQRITYTGIASLAGQGCLTAGTPGSAPNSPSPTHVAPYVTGNLTVGGAYSYLVTFVSALGESNGSAAVAATITAVPWGFNDGPGFVSGTTGGSLVSNGTYAYAVTFVTASGEVGHGTAGLSLWALGIGNTKASLTGIPTSSDARVTSRKIYRTVNGGAGDLKLVATIADNVTTTYTDSTADGSLGVTMPTTDAGSTGKLTVGIPLGPTGTTSRKLYRTSIGGTTYELQSTIANNTTTSVLDNTTDGSLGVAFAGSSLGAAAGDTTLRVTDLSKFPDGGWIRAASQVVLFTARSASSGEGTLTGIPASGAGAIEAAIPAGSTVVVEPHLTGIPSSGDGSITATITRGDSVNLLVSADDATSQSTYGVIEHYIQDRRLSIDGATQLAEAHLALLKDPRISGSFDSSDPKLVANRVLSINHATWGVTADVVVQQTVVKMHQGRPQPMLTVQVASRSVDDLYAQLRDIREQLAR